MNNEQNNMNNINQPNVGNQMSYDNRLTPNNPQPMPATPQQTNVDPIPMPDLGPINGSVPTPQPTITQNDNITGQPVNPPKPEKHKKKGNGGALIIVIVVIIVIAIAVVCFFIGKNMIDNENNNNAVITDKDKGNDSEEKSITYNGVKLIIPNGYVGELKDDSGVIFKTSNKVYSLDFYDETISDFDSALLQIGAVSKGNKSIEGISFNLYSYTKASKTEILYIVDTGTFRIMGFAVNTSYNYNEGIMNDIVTTLGGSEEVISKMTPSDAVKAKFSAKNYSTIYEFETE